MTVNTIDVTKFTTWLSTTRINYAQEKIKQNVGTENSPKIIKTLLSLSSDTQGNLKVTLGYTVLYEGTSIEDAKVAYEGAV